MCMIVTIVQQIRSSKTTMLQRFEIDICLYLNETYEINSGQIDEEPFGVFFAIKSVKNRDGLSLF